MVDDDVAQRADRVVEVAAILDAERLGHRDLHAGDVVAVPDRLEHRVGEAQVQQLLEPHLSEEVVDPVELGLVDVLVQLLVSARAEARSWPNGFSTTTRAPPCVRPGVVQALDDGREQRRRDLQVEDGQLRVADRLLTRCVGRRLRKVAAHVGQALREAREDVFVERSRRVAAIDSRACSRSCSIVQSSTATPTTGQSSSPRRSSR